MQPYLKSIYRVLNIVLLLSIFNIDFTMGQESNQQNLYTQLIDNKEYQKALSYLSAHLQQAGSPKDSIYTTIGYIYLTMEDYNNSLEALNHAIKLSPNSEYAHIYRFQCYQATKNYQKSLSDINVLIKIAPLNANYYEQRYQVYTQLGNYNLALKEADRLIQLDKKNDHYYLLKGFCLTNLKQDNEAIKSIRKSININPNNAKAFQMKAAAEFYQDDIDSAKKDFTKATQLDSLDTYNWIGLASINYTLKNYAFSLANLNKVEYINPNAEGINTYKGKIYFRLGRYDSAIIRLNKAIKLNPLSDTASYFLGRTYTELKKYDLALKYYNMSCILDNKNPELYKFRAILYKKMGKKKLAESDEKKERILNPSREIFE